MQVIQRTNKLNHKKRPSFASRFFFHLLAIALRLPNSNGEQETQRTGRVLPAAILPQNFADAQISGVPLRSCHPSMLAFLPFAVLSFGLFGSVPVFAASSTLNLDLASDTISVDIGAANANGTFKKSANNTISVTTDHYTGYTLSIKSTDTAASTTSPALKNGSDTMPSITSSLTEEQFSSIGATNHNNKYGYLPSRICTNTNGCTSNTSFLPAPTLTGDILDKTTVANPSTANTYTMAIGARIDQTIPFGSYSNTFEVLLVANAIPYTIIYDDNVVASMPTDQDTTSATGNINFSSNTPTRKGYTFAGWCSVSPGTSQYADTCSGTTYQPGDSYTLDQTAANNLHLYAMWKRNTMQNVAEWKDALAVNEETTAIDARDGKTYSVARLCMSTTVPTTAGACNKSNSTLWMTQNLDLLVGGAGVGSLSSNDSDINSNLGSAMGYSTSGDVITWTPNSTLNIPAVITNHTTGSPASSLSGWTNDNNIPYQGEGGDYYIFTSSNTNTDAVYASLTSCVNAGHTVEECNHYHVGNYYNWSAAVAGNNTSSYTTDLTVMPNSICPKGWRLPNGLTSSNGATIITEFNQLALAYGITTGTTITHSSESDRWVNVGWTTNGFNNFRTSPLYFVRSGNLNGSTLYLYGSYGFLWSSTVRSASWGHALDFNSSELIPAYQPDRYNGFPIRCVVR